MNLNLRLSNFLNISEDIDFYIQENIDTLKECLYNSYGHIGVYKYLKDDEFIPKTYYTCENGEYNSKFDTEKDAIIALVIYRIKLRGLKDGGYGCPLSDQLNLIKQLKNANWVKKNIKIVDNLSINEKDLFENKIVELKDIISDKDIEYNELYERYSNLNNKLNKIKDMI